MSKSSKISLKLVSSIFFITIVLLQSCSSSDDESDSVLNPQTANFISSTLPGTYNLVFASEAGTHVYNFNSNNTVLINYADGTVDTENWSVNSSGQLVIKGSVNDLFTITSGDQFSGNLNVLLREPEPQTTNEIKTTGTITIQ